MAGTLGSGLREDAELNNTAGKRAALIWPKALPAVPLQGALGSLGTLWGPFLVP